MRDLAVSFEKQCRYPVIARSPALGRTTRQSQTNTSNRFDFGTERLPRGVYPEELEGLAMTIRYIVVAVKKNY